MECSNTFAQNNFIKDLGDEISYYQPPVSSKGRDDRLFETVQG